MVRNVAALLLVAGVVLARSQPDSEFITLVNPLVLERNGLSETYPEPVFANPFAVVGNQTKSASICLDCKSGTENVFLQSKLYPEWAVRSKYGFRYNFQVFDNLGQFVSKTSGEITPEMILKLQPDATGYKTLRFRWLPMTKDRTKAGTGVYVLKGKVIPFPDGMRAGAQGDVAPREGAVSNVLLSFGYLRQK
ncbi:MAG: hypothetical protein JWO30_2686 [Fibrobacteres bacterium]|nr:hypothetical protein [Fibrobacterota bacterium]